MKLLSSCLLVVLAFAAFVAAERHHSAQFAGEVRSDLIVRASNSSSSGEEGADGSLSWLGFDSSVSWLQLILVCLVCFVGGAFCSGTGVGGGGFYLPAYIYVLGLSSHEAIPLSKATIFGLASAVYFFNVKKRHPHADKPLIAYNVGQVMEPMSLAGTVVGVLLNVVVPSVVTLLILVAVFAISGWKTLQKSLTLYKSETGTACSWPLLWSLLTCKRKLSEPGAESGGDDQHVELTVYSGLRTEESPQGSDDDNVDGGDDYGNGLATTHSDNDDHEANEEEGIEARIEAVDTEDSVVRARIVKQDQMTVPWQLCWLLVLIWAVILGLGLLRSLVPALTCGSAGSWAVLALQLVIPLAGGLYACRAEIADHATRLRLRVPIPPGDPQWTWKGAAHLSVFSFLAGVLAAFVGIGGGLVKGPLMLELGMVPTVVAATSTYMIVFTASASSIQYMMLGTLSPASFLLFFVVGAVGATCGQMVLSEVLKRYNKQHVITFLLAFVILVSGILFVISALIDIVNKGAAAFAFSSLCST